MTRSLLGLSVVAVAACGAGDLDVVPMAGDYAVSWTCASTACSSPLSSTTRATIDDGDSSAVVRWERGAGNVIATHEGARDEMTECADVPAGADGGVARSGYSLCFDDMGLWANPCWGDSCWVVELTSR